MSFIKFHFDDDSFTVDLPDKMINENPKEDIGESIDDFIPLQIIGEGGFGNVLKVKSKKNNKIYAMKIINKENINNMIRKMIEENNLDEEISEEKYSKKEILILKKLNHPNIVKIYSDFMDEENYYIILEYIEGQNLYQIYSNNNIQILTEEKFIWDLLGQCLDAIVYIHGKGVIHRDLKYGNILIEEKTWKIKIIDFNTSAVMDIAAAQDFVDNNNIKDKLNLINEGTYINNNCGAPEIENSEYDAKIDVFSIGTIFKWLCSRFDRDDGKYYRYSKELTEIIDKMIEEKDSRPTSNEIYNLYKKYYSHKYIKYSSIFSCFHCLYNFPIWQKELNMQFKKFKKNEVSKYFFQFLVIFLKNYQFFEDYIKEFKMNQLQLLFENNDKCQEIDPILFIKHIMAKLNDELNTIIPNSIEFKSVEKKVLKEEKYLNYKNKYKSLISSIISKNFFGLLELKKQCKKCHLKDYSFNYFSFLCFNMETLIEKNIELRPDKLFDTLEIDYKRDIVCKNCKTLTTHAENIRFFKIPKNLIIYFNKKRKNSKEKIKINKFIDFPEKLIIGKMHVEILLSQNYPDEIEYYLSSVLCQDKDNKGEEFYISFTRDFSPNQINNINNNDKYYDFSEIKNKYNIIGLFYLSDDEEVINNYREGQQIYKLNKSNQNISHKINELNVINNNNINQDFKFQNNNIRNHTNKNNIYENKGSNIKENEYSIKGGNINDNLKNERNSSNYFNTNNKINNKEINYNSKPSNNNDFLYENNPHNPNSIHYINNKENNILNLFNNNNFLKADKNLLFTNNYEGSMGGSNNNYYQSNAQYLNNPNLNYNFNNAINMYNMPNNSNISNSSNSRITNNIFNNQPNNIFK